MSSQPPTAHREFVGRFPKLGRAWDLAGEQGADGPLDFKTQRLVKLGIAAGTMRQGAVHAAVRRARDAGVTLEEMEQVVALAASNIGLPSAVAVWTWVRDETSRPGREAPRQQDVD
jgi:alkylhydroperoxidase/carboxymuconolactone decarboxylase family protein YurZ